MRLVPPAFMPLIPSSKPLIVRFPSPTWRNRRKSDIFHVLIIVILYSERWQHNQEDMMAMEDEWRFGQTSKNPIRCKGKQNFEKLVDVGRKRYNQCFQSLDPLVICYRRIKTNRKYHKIISPPTHPVAPPPPCRKSCAWKLRNSLVNRIRNSHLRQKATNSTASTRDTPPCNPPTTVHSFAYLLPRAPNSAQTWSPLHQP